MRELQKVKCDQTDWSDLESIGEYNEYCRQLRSQYEWEKE